MSSVKVICPGRRHSSCLGIIEGYDITLESCKHATLHLQEYECTSITCNRTDHIGPCVPEFEYEVRQIRNQSIKELSDEEA